jgi:hypothetical protein
MRSCLQQEILISRSWLKDLLLETGLGDAEERLVDEEKKEYKYVITKNSFKELQVQVQEQAKELATMRKEFANLKIELMKKGGRS